MVDGVFEEVAGTADGDETAASPAVSFHAANVKAQLNAGADTNSQQPDWRWSDCSMFNPMGGDSDGVGHFHAKWNTGQIIRRMLIFACSGTAGAAGYTYGPVQ